MTTRSPADLLRLFGATPIGSPAIAAGSSDLPPAAAAGLPAYSSSNSPAPAVVLPASAAPFSAANAASAAPPLRIVSWNIGLRGLQQLCSSKASDMGAVDTHGISRRMGFGSLGAMLRHLDADIVCLQETKLAALGAPERAIGERPRTRTLRVPLSWVYR